MLNDDECDVDVLVDPVAAEAAFDAECNAGGLLSDFTEVDGLSAAAASACAARNFFFGTTTAASICTNMEVSQTLQGLLQGPNKDKDIPRLAVSDQAQLRS